jgi:hypothetical protein
LELFLSLWIDGLDMESKRLEGRLLRAGQITNGESMWGANERRERPTSASTRARVVSIAGIEVLMVLVASLTFSVVLLWAKEKKQTVGSGSLNISPFWAFSLE